MPDALTREILASIDGGDFVTATLCISRHVTASLRVNDRAAFLAELDQLIDRLTEIGLAVEEAPVSKGGDDV
jgi:hypothetical protein